MKATYNNLYKKQTKKEIITVFVYALHGTEEEIQEYKDLLKSRGGDMQETIVYEDPHDEHNLNMETFPAFYSRTYHGEECEVVIKKNKINIH